MASGNEDVTLKQFKVWASKQGGGEGGGSMDILMDSPAGDFTIPAETAALYKGFMVIFGEDYMVGFDKNETYIRTDMYNVNVSKMTDGSTFMLFMQGMSTTAANKVYGIKEF